MSRLALRDGAPARSATEVGPGDYVKVGSQWREVASNSAFGAERLPRSWEVRTVDGGSHGMLGVQRYAKAQDMEGGRARRGDRT